jgi:homogentisate 1,2-dioxygenase
VYRIAPSAKHTPFKETPERNPRLLADFAKCTVTPNQLRWDPFPLPTAEEKVDFVSGISTLMGSGSAETKTGMAIHVYCCNTDMTHKQAFMNADGDLLIVPQLNTLLVRTEFGMLHVAPWDCCVIPRGVKFSVDLGNKGESARGYIAEIFTHSHLILPDLGPIGANGLADGRHFAHPTADYIDEEGEFTVVHKFMGKLFEATMSSCPFDVVAYHGNYLPYKYDLNKYCVINSVKFDHLDPSIFTVLTCQTNEPGVAVLDFVIFPPRYAVQKDTFRPPYYHKNCMSEFMGNIAGQYEAKPDGFQPGGGSLHSIMTGHGPDADSYKKFTEVDTSSPVEMPSTDLAFMFESTYMFKLTPYAMDDQKLQSDYYKCWQGLDNEFNANNPEPTFKTK